MVLTKTGEGSASTCQREGIQLWALNAMDPSVKELLQRPENRVCAWPAGRIGGLGVDLGWT